jgi:hypothetical protein
VQEYPGVIWRLVHIVKNLFDSALDQTLPNFTQTIDVAYIDGNQEKTATFNYLELLRPHLSRSGIVLFDDIHWTKDMEDAWQVISQCQGFSYTIDLGRIGLGVWDGKTAHPKTYSLAIYTDYSQRGKPKIYQKDFKS